MTTPENENAENEPGADSTAPAAAAQSDYSPSDVPAAPADSVQHVDEDNQLPKTGAEGGVTEEGTGAFAPEESHEPDEAGEGKVVVEDAFGHRFEVPVGADGENPVSPQNPQPKAVRA